MSPEDSAASKRSTRKKAAPKKAAKKSVRKSATSQKKASPKKSVRSSATSAKTTTRKKAAPKKVAAKKAAPKKAASESVSSIAKASSVTRETVLNRISDTLRTTMVVKVARAVVGLLVTIFIAALPSAIIGWLTSPTVAIVLGIMLFAGLIFGAYFSVRESMPEPASLLPFLKDRAFVWINIFGDERPQLLPSWLVYTLWAPNELITGMLPTMRMRKLTAGDRDAAAGMALELASSSFVEITEPMAVNAPRTAGLRVLLLAGLARLSVNKGAIRAKLTSVGHAAIFEGTIS